MAFPQWRTRSKPRTASFSAEPYRNRNDHFRFRQCPEFASASAASDPIKRSKSAGSFSATIAMRLEGMQFARANTRFASLTKAASGASSAVSRAHWQRLRRLPLPKRARAVQPRMRADVAMSPRKPRRFSPSALTHSLADAYRHDVRRHSCTESCPNPVNGMRADANELVHTGEPPEGPIADSQ